MARDFPTTEFIEFSNTTEFSPEASDVTMHIWVNPDVTDGTRRRWFPIQSTQSSLGFAFMVRDGAADRIEILMRSSDDSTTIKTVSSAVLTDNEWQHIMMIWVESSATLFGYRNTTEVASVSGSGKSSPKIDSWFKINVDGAETYDGQAAFAAVWKAEIASEKRAALNRGANPFVMQHDDLIFYAPLHGNDDPEDEYVNALTGTLTGTTKANANPPVELLENYL